MTVSVSLLLATSNVNAQPNPGPGNQNGGIGTTKDGPTVPLDGGLSLLLIGSGIGYCSKKLRKAK